MTMSLRWDDLRLFLAVVEHGSLSAAARALRLGQPTLSRRIGELEEVVGNALFERHSVGSKLTETGEKLLPAAQRMAEWAHQAEQNISVHTNLPEGRVRIAAPPGIAFELLAPLARKVREQYPALHLEALSAVETLNLGRGEADISLRTNRPSDADLVCVDQIDVQVQVYVSKSYAKRLKSNVTLAELDWICWAEPYEHLFVNQALRAMIPNFRPAFASDDFNVQLAACRAGVGAMALANAPHRYSFLSDLHRLDFDLGPKAIGSLYLVVHKRHRNLPKVRCVLEFIQDEFKFLRQTLSGEK
jgi:DNA-binding transcriptional LysR family regulator